MAVLIPLVAGRENFVINPIGSETLTNSLLMSLAVFAVAAAWEEAFFRGYLLQTFVRSGFAIWAVLGMSCFFGLVHMGNKDATLLSGTNTALAGIVFSLAYLKTRDLWFPFGIHLMWNWMQGSFFGIEVSGVTSLAKEPFLREIDSGPEWLTGASYGIEGSISCTAALVILGILIYVIPSLKPDADVLRLNQPGS
jgi:membrane protease YdiL (CAAX protease family)